MAEARKKHKGLRKIFELIEKLRKIFKKLRKRSDEEEERNQQFDIYQAACEEGTQRVYRANVIVVGQGGIGKTHLCRNLLGEEFTEDDLVTNGIALSGCVLEKHKAGTTFKRQENTSKSRSAHALIEVKEDDETATEILEKSDGTTQSHESVTLWDFGGQYVFYTTHQTFLTWRAVYLLVFDLTKGLNAPVHVRRSGTVKDIKVDIIPRTVGEFLKFWQNSIHVHTKIVEYLGSEYICPKIILVGTHRDKLGHTEEERKKAVEERFSEIQEYLHRRPAHDMHVQPYLYAVNNCDPQDAGIQELRQEICKTIKEQPYWGEEQPLKYVLLEKRLEEISDTRKCLSLDEVLEIGKQHGLLNDEMVIHFLKFYSDLGELVFFNEDDTRNIVILDPQWLIDAFSSLITVEKYHKGSSPEAMGYWDLLDDRGELDERLIDIVWEEEAELKENKAILLHICQRFDLLVELQEEDADGQRKKYIVPCVLKNHPNPEGYLKIPERPPEGYLEMQKNPPLYLIFDGGFCPPGLFHRLVVCCYRKWPSYDKYSYCDYACFKVDRSTHTILELSNKGDGVFQLMVGSLKKGFNDLESDNAFQVLTYINKELDRLIGAYSPYLKYDIGFRFPYGLEKLTEDLKIKLLESDDACPPGCPVVIETAPYRKWLGNNESAVCPSVRISADVYPPDDLVCDLSRRIEVEWEEVAAYLGVERPQIDQLKLNFPSDTLGQIRNMLFQWREGMGASSNEERRDKLKRALAKACRGDLADSLGLQSDEDEKGKMRGNVDDPKMRMTGAVPHDYGKLLEGRSHQRYTTEDALSLLPEPTKSATVKGSTTADLEEKIEDELSKIGLGDACMLDDKSDLYLAATRDDYQGIGRLIDEGVNVNSQDNAGRSSLHLAAENGCIKIVKCLIDKGADVNILDDEGKSSLYLALENRHGDISTMLYDAGADQLGLRAPVPNEDKIKMGRIIQDSACGLAEKHSSLCGIYPACTFHKGGTRKVPYFVIVCNDKEKKAEFPSQLGGYAVLVKEGSVKFFADNGDQQGAVGGSCELFIGCPVGVSQTNGYGSLGFFTNTDGSQVNEVKPDSFITCYHVVGAYSEPAYSSVGRPIASRVCNRECGRVCKSFIGSISYDNQWCGVDATLIALKDQTKVNVTPKIQNNNILSFASLGYLDVQSIEDDEVVYKYGFQTGYTKGHYDIDDSFWRNPLAFGDSKLLFNMIKVFSVSKPECSDFAREGDSGAAVFVKRNGFPYIIGLVVAACTEKQQGKTKCKSIILSRIGPTLQSMGVSIYATSEPMDTV